MILWPGGTGPYPAPPQLLSLCWGPDCSLLLSLTLFHGITITLCTHKAGVGAFFNYFRKVCLGNTRMSHVCRLRVHRGCSPHCHSRHRSVALVWKGTGELPAFSACLPAPQSLPKPLLPCHPLDKDLYPRHAALHWVTSSLLQVPTLPGLAGFSGNRFAGGREGGWLSAGV